MASRHILTVNQVLEIMLRWLDTKDWEKAFLDVIPKRKLPEGQGNKLGDVVESEETLQEDEFEESEGLELEETDEVGDDVKSEEVEGSSSKLRPLPKSDNPK